MTATGNAARLPPLHQKVLSLPSTLAVPGRRKSHLPPSLVKPRRQVFKATWWHRKTCIEKKKNNSNPVLSSVVKPRLNLQRHPARPAKKRKPKAARKPTELEPHFQ